MDNREIQRKLEQAYREIEEIQELRRRILGERLGQKRGDLGEEKAKAVLSMLDRIEAQSSALVFRAEQAFGELEQSTRDGSNDATVQQQSGLSGIISSIGDVASQGVDSIIGAVEPATTGVLKASDQLAKSTLEAAQSVSKSIMDTTNEVSGQLLDSSKNMASSLMTQTGNLANSLTGEVKDTVNTILGKDNPQAPVVTQQILNPTSTDGSPNPPGINSMAANTATVTSGLVNSTGAATTALVQSVAADAAGLVNSATAATGKMLQKAVSFAGDMAGGAAKPVVEVVLGPAAATAMNGMAQGLGGMFGAAVNAASTAAGGVATAATTLATNLTKGVAQLASDLIGGAAGVASDMAGAGVNAAGKILGTAAQTGKGILAAASDVTGSMFDTASSIGKNLLNAVGGITNSLTDGEGGLLSGAKDVIGGLADFAGKTLDSASDLASGVLGSAGKLANTAIDTTTGMAGSLLNGATGLVGGVLGGAVGAIGKLAGGISGGQGSISSAATALLVGGGSSSASVAPGSSGGKTSSSSGNKNNASDGNSNAYGNSSNSMNNITPNSDGGSIVESDITNKTYGWQGEALMRDPKTIISDGDQQLFNPYTSPNAEWTIYSFRPCDTGGEGATAGGKLYPRIAITPSSFEAIRSIDTMLNHIPFVVVREYFFKNTASNVMSFMRKISGLANEVYEEMKKKKNKGYTPPPQGEEDKTNFLLERIDEVFGSVPRKLGVIDIPYLLYQGLRRKMYGNTYVFPYIVNSSTVINQASNASEWGNDGSGGGVIGMLKNIAQQGVNLIGGFAAGMIGSQAQVANLFPAPSWSNSNKDKISFSFTLVLINDHAAKARNNYMCVNTIIHNNRSLQKTILAFPGALYEVWLPTGQRHLMCTGEFKLYPLGLNRKPPTQFFDTTGAGLGGNGNFKMGSVMEAEMAQPHDAESEVIPDAYKLDVTFTSCLANNMNTSVFQYYVNMTGFRDFANAPRDNSADQAAGQNVADSLMADKNGLGGKVQDVTVPAENNNQGQGGGDSSGGGEAGTQGVSGIPPTRGNAKSKSARDNSTSNMSLADVLESVETFDESTYNLKLDKLQASFGDAGLQTESVITTVKKSQKAVRESTEFLSKLYNSDSSNLWYRPHETDEIYTTFDLDYRQQLKNKYGERLNSIRGIDSQIKGLGKEMAKVAQELSNAEELDARTPLLERQVETAAKIQNLLRKKDSVADELIQMDAEIINAAFDEQDKAVSIKKNEITVGMLAGVWNEKIMNSYEKDKLQYLTSYEKERYFKDKVRQLSKYDKYGILNHQDWFFRVAVLDFVVGEMQRLILWFKDCRYDDYETVYRIMRKLRLLLLDVDSVKSSQDFDINHTNLFYLSDSDVQQFTKIDTLLDGNTLYDLFQSQLRINFAVVEKPIEVVEVEKPTREDIQEQRSESTSYQQRKVRNEIVKLNWGSEKALTKLAYEMAISGEKSGTVTVVLSNGVAAEFKSIKELKDTIIELKVKSGKTQKENDELVDLVGAFTNQINIIKEGMVIEKMNEMKQTADQMIEQEDNTVAAPVVK